MGKVLVGVESGAENGFFRCDDFDSFFGVYFFCFLIPKKFFGIEFFFFDGGDDDIVADFGELLVVVIDSIIGTEGGVEGVALVEFDFESVWKLGVWVFALIGALEGGCIELGFDDGAVAVGDLDIFADLGVVFA